MERYLCIHAHFYQPPRENPWLETVELQDSAYPFHDWNERITAECYAPNSASRILSGDRIVDIVSNYSKISFNFGPTLLSWLEQNSPEVYAGILDADRASAERFGGHGSAMAQVYNHMILPLASRADKQTQIEWGIRDFEHRFGRKPEGMWLAETAVDLETLQVLAEAGIKFTVLAPHQAARVRGRGGENWEDVGGARIDPTMAYVQCLPSGREINVFFYDGPISRAVAFEGLLSNGETFAARLMSGFSETRERPELMHIATDGETYGHHHKYGDMALAYALHHIESNGLARLTNYGEFLDKFPPTHEVEIVENTSWSCAHGIERWRSDCGCNSGGHAGWNQQWRGPLRDALDWLRDTLVPLYEQSAAELLKDPARARNDYIDVVLDRSPENISAFFSRHARKRLLADERTRALRLLEMQRHAMLMFTSCGWFFDELSGIETTQVIFYAGRAIQLAQQLFGDHLEEHFEERLTTARSNLSEQGDAREIYRKWVKTSAVDLQKVAAHYAISLLFSRIPTRPRPTAIRPRAWTSGASSRAARGWRSAARSSPRASPKTRNC
jgi:alpha-amylase/alpha-mannosidase (GH57 family)